MRWAYYLKLAVLDFARLWASTQHHVIIVAGIVLPILLLLGLKRGHVAELRSELLRSPTGRQVTFWSGQQGELMQADSIERLSSELPAVEIIIPDVDRIVQVSSLGSPASPSVAQDAGSREAVSVTLCATRAGDPVLQQAGCGLQGKKIDEIVLAQTVAERLHLGQGDQCRITVRRRTEDSDETAETTATIAAILQQGDTNNAIGFAQFELLDQFEQWIRGYSATKLGWSSSGTPAPPRYVEYLVFTEGASGLSKEDEQAFRDRGFDVEVVENPIERGLGGLIEADARTQLQVHKIRPSGSTATNPILANVLASELEAVTQADDVVIPWNPPYLNNATQTMLVGVTLKKRSWLRNYLIDRDSAFEPSVDRFVYLPTEHHSAQWDLPLRGNRAITLEPYQPGDHEVISGIQPAARIGSDGGKPDMIVIPVPLLARLWAYERGENDYDATRQVFTSIAQPSVYGKARLFADSIDDVPAVVAALLERNFQVTSESGRISEIQDQDSSLRLLVLVVGMGVFLFGLVTVFSVLVDSTDRKRGVIGILRVMGVSGGGIFCLVLLRAIAIGILAGLVSTAAGLALQQFLAWKPAAASTLLGWKPHITILISARDVLVVMLGAVTCAAVGALFPAWKASRLDPFDAILEGRFV
jgi:ABC-type lipoprotein release transport system permease subunit